jgi:DNA-directed RNA polymerase beta subunit
MSYDTDITAFLEQLGYNHDNIHPETEDADLTHGTAEIDNDFDKLTQTDILGYLDEITAGDEKAQEKPAPPKERKQEKVYPAEAPVDIDKEITTGDMLAIVRTEIERKGIAGHHIDSVNSFNKVGIKQIVTKVFTVEGRLKNQRDKTEEDKEISDITFRVDFTDINLTQPTTVKYKSGALQMLTPNMARTKNLTYSAQMFIDFTVTATAHYKNGSTKTRTAESRDHRISSIPTCVGTELCNTYNCSKATLKALEEDPADTGGYYIIKGGEWTVDNLENITNNTFHVHRNMYMNEIVRGTFLSKPGDAFENSYQVILRYLNNGLITIEITTTKFDKFEIPYYLIFRALGMTRDVDIVNNIVYGVDNTDPVTKHMLDVLEKTFTVDDGKFGPIRKSTDSAEIIQFIASKINEAQSVNAARKDDNIAKYLNNSILNIVDRYIFPHIGTGVEHRIKKLKFLGHLINKMLRVEMGVLESTDRDSYKNKRVFAAGTSIAKTFKTLVNIATVQEIKKQLMKDFKTTPFGQVQLAESVKAAINSDDLERMLVQAITTGNKTITMKRNEITNRISSQTLYHKNDLNVKSTLNTINTPNTTANKQNERADEMRRVHPTYLGYIDISQSADTGEKVGMTKQMACTASVCGASSSFILKQIINEDPDLIPLDEVLPEQITSEKLAKVFVNGDWIGCCRESHKLVQKYRIKRRHEDINHLTTIVWEPLVREVYFWTDVGRLMRPLVIVYNNIEQCNEAWRKGDMSVKFHQWTKLTKKHIIGLKCKTINMDDLRRERVIEYISPEEQENALIADNIDKLREYEFDYRRMYTHCDIDQAIFGIVTLASPSCNHSNAVRNTMYTNHRKQSAGWFVLNYPFRIDKNATLQHYCERPIVSAFSDSLTYPNGQNCIVALALYGGFNCEDSITANMSSIDRGLFNASHYNYERAELEKGEQFGNPDQTRTMDIKKDATYEFVENGFIKEGTLAKKGYVLIVKAAKIPKPIDQYMYIDKSIVYKREEPVYIERVITTRNDEDALIAKVKYRADRPLAVGDKLSSRTGNKGIIAQRIPACDMPYTEEGVTPDIIVNAHSIPTRMAVNQITETLIGKLAVHTGCFTDATTFRKLDVDGAVALLEKHGVKYGGHTRMYNGRTGEWIDTLIFNGPTTYQRLQKFVIDEHYATRSGPTSALTRQPLDGKNNDGGLRLGEMEKDVLAAHGTMRSLHDKFYKDSDGIDLPICRICNNRAVVNEKVGIYKCKYCGDNADIANVASSWVANLFMHEASAMNIKMQMELEPFQYLKDEE